MKPYPKYKDSGIEWIGVIPEEWEVKKLKYLANAKPSNIDKKSKDNEDEIFLCNYIDVYNNDFISSELDFMKATVNKSQFEKFILIKGDVIATKDSETPDDIANPALVVENFDNVVCGYHLTHIKPKNILGDYLFRQFQSKFVQAYFEISANGVTRYGIGVDKFNSVLIIVPTPEEQKSIANFLDRKTKQIDTLIRKKEKLIELLKEERTAIINHAVTKGLNPDIPMKDSGIEWIGEIPEHWEIVKLKRATRFNYGDSLSNENRQNGDVPVFGSNGIVGFHNQSITHNPCIIIGRKGSFGKINYSEYKCFPIDTTYYIDCSTTRNNICWLHYLLPILRLDSISKDSAVPGLNREEAYSKIIPLPYKSEQKAIANFLDQKTKEIDNTIEKHKKSIELLKEYRTSLISEVVTGKIDVRQEVS